MKRLPTIALSTVAALVVMASASGHASAITPHLPASTSLTTVPDKISWPNSRDFEYRVEMQAGVNGAHFIFTVPAPPWGFKGIYGSPFSFYAEPRLEGPGEIKPSLSIVADPAVFSCWRGSFAGSQFWYEVTLDSGVSTTVVVPGRLEAAPLAGMNSLTDFRMENGDDPILIDAPVAVGGKQGVRIITRMVGKDSKLPAALKSGSKFKLNGFTRPVLINRRIDITARPPTSAPRDGRPDREGRGLNVHTAGTRAEALEMLTHQPIAVAFLDIALGDDDEFDGLDICQRLKHEPIALAGGAPIVVLVSGQGKASDRVRATLAGADAYLTKPFSQHDVVRALESCGLMPVPVLSAPLPDTPPG